MNKKKYYINEDDRCVALRDFGNVKKGDVGGFVASEENLSHEGDCWVYDNAQVCDNAWVYDNARVFNNACVCGNAQVGGDAQVGGNAVVGGDAWVGGDAKIIFSIKSNNDFICLGFFGNNKRTVTINLIEKKIVCGCFYDTFDEFEKAVNERYRGGGNYYTLIKFLKTL